MALGGISEWFDDYIAGEEADPGEEPELHKGMVLLLARCWEYRLKTEDVLELCQGNRRIALCTVSRGGFERFHWYLWAVGDFVDLFGWVVVDYVAFAVHCSSLR